MTLEDWLTLERWHDELLASSREIRALEARHNREDRARIMGLRSEFHGPSDWDKVVPRGAPRLDDSDIERARAVRMHDLVGDTDRGKILCRWHDDTSPSMFVYEDGVKCFVCGKYLDPIGWVIETEGLSFPAAVRRLTGGGW